MHAGKSVWKRGIWRSTFTKLNSIKLNTGRLRCISTIATSPSPSTNDVADVTCNVIIYCLPFNTNNNNIKKSKTMLVNSNKPKQELPTSILQKNDKTQKQDISNSLELSDYIKSHLYIIHTILSPTMPPLLKNTCKYIVWNTNYQILDLAWGSRDLWKTLYTPWPFCSEVTHLSLWPQTLFLQKIN